MANKRVLMSLGLYYTGQCTVLFELYSSHAYMGYNTVLYTTGHTRLLYRVNYVNIYMVPDMQNVKLFTQAGFFNPKIYPKAHSLCLYQISDKKA